MSNPNHLTPEQLDALEAAAKLLNGHRWHTDGKRVETWIDMGIEPDFVADCSTEGIAAFVEKAQPQTILALIAQVRQPADDAEPITEDWLRSVGFGEPTINGWPILFENKGVDPIELWLNHDNNVALLQSNSDDFVLIGAEYRTRGQLCRLCAALGVTMKEPSNA